MKILLLSDSLALPRTIPEICYYEDTYPALLSKKHTLLSFSMGGARINTLMSQTFYYKAYNPDIIIIQSGIVDCAPRMFKKWEERILNHNKFTRSFKYLIKKIGKNTIRNTRNITWTSTSQYKSFCRALITEFPNAFSFALSILPASDEYDQKVKNIRKNINNYNSILKDVFKDNYISLFNIPAEGIMSDGHHLNKIGHQYVYKQILHHIEIIEK